MNDEERYAERADPAARDDDPFAGPEGALAAEVLVSSLAPSELPAGGWERLSAAVAGGAGAAAGRDAARGPAPGPALPEARPSRASPPRRPWGLDLALAAAVAALAAVGTWGVLQRSEAARLRDDQRILAYWMSNPGMVLTPLEPAEGAPATRLGVLCVLPDGRALVLQPEMAARGETYVVVGRGAGGERELARGRENMLQFDVTGVEVVEVRSERGQRTETLAVARLDR